MAASPQRGAVLVTGASTGIGEATARRMAAAGFGVFAGVRRPQDAERLREADPNGRIEPLTLDVTDAAQIESAVAQVRGAVGASGLAGLVNNAGIAVPAPLEYVPIDAFRRQIDVNLVGQVAVTQAFLPLLRDAPGGGRIVFVGSIGGLVALPMVSGYIASKFALEGLADSLRRELRGQGIRVAIVEPGTIATPIWKKGGAEGDELIERMPPDGHVRYAAFIAALRKATVDGERTGLPPDAVARTIEHALSAGRPRTRYVVGREAKLRALLNALLPDRAMDALVAAGLRASTR
jgi:NAD(P)-dependent dehydrogenase (short-subunit alcohol dehydrogenase family)